LRKSKAEIEDDISIRPSPKYMWAESKSMNIRLLLLFGILSAFALALPCSAQGDYSIINPSVNPEYGYDDFTYSAQVATSSGRVGEIAVTKYYMELRIYNDGELLGSFPSEATTGLKKSTFEFGPYNFENRFGIKETNNATFEFTFYAGGRQVAKTEKIKGPVVSPPAMTGINYEKNPYFFQGIEASAAFRDQGGLTPAPTCHLEVTGPLGTPNSSTWITADTPCRSSGRSGYSCTVSEDMDGFQDGGNFSFNLIYNNLKFDPLTFGPYNVTLHPYTPSVERLVVPKQLDYTNFTIQAFVRDAGARMVGGATEGCTASLVISHPQRGEQTYVSTEPLVQGSSLVYQWDQSTVPSPFNRSDVQLSRTAPFSARVVYKNEKWNYQAEKANVSFRVVEEIPKIDLQYPSVVYVRPGESSRQDIVATVAFSKGSGDLELGLSGPDMNINRTIKPAALGGNMYQFKSQIEFDGRHANNNYTLTLSFVNPSLEGGRYDFEERYIKVAPISVQFLNASVTPQFGLWNDSYTYSVLINSTVVPLDVSLQTYDPCSREWTDRASLKAEQQSTPLNFTLYPFDYECDEMQQEEAKYRFKASFAGVDYASKPQDGPSLQGGSPVIISLDSDPVVYVSEGSETAAAISAVVQYGAGQGQATLRLSGPDKSFEEADFGTALGGNRYRYDWSPAFSSSDAGKSFNYTIGFRHASQGTEVQIAGGTIEAKPVSISFSDGSVLPGRGRWNDSFTYTVKAASSVNAKAALEVYNPCSREWVERASGTIAPGEGYINMTAQPFQYRCAEAEGSRASFRFSAVFAGQRIVSDVYSGPEIAGGRPELVSLDYTPVLYVSAASTSYQVVNAIVESPLGPGRMSILISPKMDDELYAGGSYLGGERYAYTWSIPFGLQDAGNHKISLKYIHSDLTGGEMSFPEQEMTVTAEDNPEGGQPKLLYMDYSPILYIEDGRAARQNITAEVYSPSGRGELDIAITGPDKTASSRVRAEDKGDGVYVYRWSELFNSDNIGKSYTISSTYLVGGNSYNFNDRIMTVVNKDDTVSQVWEPALNLRYDPIVDIPAAKDAEGIQHIKATVIYPDGEGELKLNISGENRQFEETLEAASSSKDRFVYEKNVPFNSTHAGNIYKISVSFLHPDLPGGAYRFTDYFMRVRQDVGGKTEEAIPEIKGSVSPERGVLQAWEEENKLYSFTYTAQIENLTSGEMPWVELSVKAPRGLWKLVGEKKQYDPSRGNLSWTVKPFYDTEFLGTAEFKFLVDGAESPVFEGPEIVAIYKDLDYQKSTVPNRFSYSGKVNASINLTVDLLSSEDNIKWRSVGQPKKYLAGSGEKEFIWANQPAYRYYEFDFKTADGKVIS